MKMSYFNDTDTLYIEFRESDIVETRGLDVNRLLDLDSKGNIVAITVEHASNMTDVHHLSLSGLDLVAYGRVVRGMTRIDSFYPNRRKITIPRIT
jgi:uncharacterized protein YuzE